MVPELEKRSGDVAVITGGARGIGAEVVKQLLQCEMHIIIGKLLWPKGVKFKAKWWLFKHFFISKNKTPSNVFWPH